MPPRSTLARLEPVALALALSSPIPMLLLAPDGPELLRLLLVAAVPAAVAWAIYRLAIRGRPAAQPRPGLVPPPLGAAPEATRASPFRVLRGGAVVLQGAFDDVVLAARAGRLAAFDVVEGGGIAAAPADLAELAPWVPSRLEARARRAYVGYLALALGASASGIAVLAAARLAERGGGQGSALLVLLFVLALAPLPSLRRTWRRLEAARARGLVPEPPPPLTWGSAPLDAALAAPAPATRRVLVLVVAVSALALVLPEDDLLLRLAKDNEAIRAGEVWRLLTAGLVHGGAFHLMMNGAVLANLGGFVERLVGGRRMLLVLWGGVLAGSLASYATNPNPSVGISGGLFALVGALLAIGLRHRRTLPAPARRMLVRAPIEIVVLNVALGLAIPFIDNAAHLGGLAAGVLLGLALPRPPSLARTLGSPPAEGGTSP
jgi:membrane associated rhomboid family serine protease